MVTRVCVSVCLSVCLSAAACPHYCTDPDVNWRSGRGCPLKGKERKSIYTAPFCTEVHTKRSGMDHTVLPANNTMPAFPSWRSPDVTTTATEAADIQLQLTTLVVHCWANLQSVHGLRCYGNITSTRNVSEYTCLYSLYAWFWISCGFVCTTKSTTHGESCRTSPQHSTKSYSLLYNKSTTNRTNGVRTLSSTVARLENSCRIV